jgi:hypothetical protein
LQIADVGFQIVHPQSAIGNRNINWQRQELFSA